MLHEDEDDEQQSEFDRLAEEVLEENSDAYATMGSVDNFDE